MSNLTLSIFSNKCHDLLKDTLPRDIDLEERKKEKSQAPGGIQTHYLLKDIFC